MSLPNTANAIARGSLFPAELVPGFLNQVKGRSSLAALCGSEPIPFNGKEYFTFNMDNDIDVVAEAGAKSAGGGQVGSKTINPRTGNAASGTIGNNHLDYACGTSVTYLGSSSTADENIEAAIAGVNGYDHDISGAIMGSTIRAALAALKDSDQRPVFPELAWGGKPATLRGLKVDFNGPTVEFNSAKARAYVGDFANYFKWGIAKEMPIEVIQYGNPDNDAEAGDLKGHNQVYIRGEAYIGWGILDGTAFGKIATA